MEPKYTFNYSQETSTAALRRCHSELCTGELMQPVSHISLEIHNVTTYNL